MYSSSTKQHALLLATLALTGRSYAYGCGYDSFGNYYCDGLSYGARVGLAVAIIAILTGVILLMFYLKRRRIQRFQQQYSNNQQTTIPGQGYYGQNQQQQPYPQGGAQGQFYQAPQQGYYYGPQAEAWHPPPPAYQAPPDSKASMNAGPNEVSTPGPHPTFAPPAGPPPTESAGYRV